MHETRAIPLVKWSALLIVTGIVVGAAICGLAMIGVKADERVIVRKAILATTITTIVSGVFGLVPVTMLRKLGGPWAAFGWLAAMPLRFAMSVAAMAALVAIGKLPVAATVVTMIVVYIALLAVETTLMFKFMQAEPGADPDAAAGNEK